jgi:hypothetical protein
MYNQNYFRDKMRRKSASVNRERQRLQGFHKTQVDAISPGR